MPLFSTIWSIVCAALPTGSASAVLGCICMPDSADCEHHSPWSHSLPHTRILTYMHHALGIHPNPPGYRIKPSLWCACAVPHGTTCAQYFSLLYCSCLYVASWCRGAQRARCLQLGCRRCVRSCWGSRWVSAVLWCAVLVWYLIVSPTTP
jgi:hypothetical protein